MPSGCCLLMKAKSLEWDEQNSDRNDAIGSVQNFLDSFELTQRKLSFNYLASCASTCSLQCCFFWQRVWGLEVPVLFHVIELAHGFWAILVFTLSPEHPRLAQAATSVGWTTSWCGFIQCWNQQLWSLLRENKFSSAPLTNSKNWSPGNRVCKTTPEGKIVPPFLETK